MAIKTIRHRTKTQCLAALLLLIGCATDSVVTDTWPNGNIQRQATVLDGDTVHWELFDEEGRLTKVSNWEKGQPHGTWKAFYPDGTQWSEHHYVRGVQVGEYRTWHPNGQPFIEGQYDSIGEPVGTWTFVDEQGIRIKEVPGTSIHN